MVTVGKGGLIFDPENVVAAHGDTVEYKFFAKVSIYPTLNPLKRCHAHKISRNTLSWSRASRNLACL